ncbi:hypothetical protein OESDEN_08943 [Oesophagostomum dentatum]|uniref:SXP/RAL-2 family protein Ani s 5-like cation-binding domain-containing protein n=1 Tax=Oesophagostomum dentatum TaxID=61180 RepID=A0A0B1T504_OESDE|nr:hypothetical protein OESDEN_08943 [Oesophagostomum dentatum]
MRRVLFVLALAGAVLCEPSEELSSSDSDVQELEEPQKDKDTKKAYFTAPYPGITVSAFFVVQEEFKKMMEEVKQDVREILIELPKALLNRTRIIEDEKLSHKEKHEAMLKLVKQNPKLYLALKAIFHIVRPRRGRHFPRPFPRRPFPLLRPGKGGRGPRGPRPEKRGLKGERREETKTEELKKVVPVKA